MISVLNTGFIICLSAAILFFVISVVLFFVFDIKTIYMIRSGRAQAKSVKEMQEANAGTGRLRDTKAAQKKKKSYAYATPDYDSAPVQQQAEPAYADSDASKTEPLGISQSDDGSDETMLLSQNQPDYDDGSAETMLLSQNQPDYDDGSAETSVLNYAAETSVLSQGSATDVLNASTAAQPANGIYFEIVKKVVCRDTDEVIR